MMNQDFLETLHLRSAVIDRIAGDMSSLAHSAADTGNERLAKRLLDWSASLTKCSEDLLSSYNRSLRDVVSQQERQWTNTLALVIEKSAEAK
jgi:hypothetical protein